MFVKWLPAWPHTTQKPNQQALTAATLDWADKGNPNQKSEEEQSLNLSPGIWDIHWQGRALI